MSHRMQPNRSHRYPRQTPAPRPVRFAPAGLLALALLFASLPIASRAQVFTVSTNGKGHAQESGAVDVRYAQIEPTKVALPAGPLDTASRLDLVRALTAEQGFAMKPFPRGHKGLTLAANGKLTPAGESYLDMTVKEGLSAKPGERLVLTDVKIEKDRIVFDLNGGPDAKHRFLRHVSVGANGGDAPVVRDDGQEAVGARLTLTFSGPVPPLTGAQVKALIAPLISFDVKSPMQAFTDTLPAPLKQAILDHQVLVGMTTQMVLFAKGQPETKSREMDGQTPFEEWIYGKSPQDIYFVRIHGDRVIRVTVGKTGQPLEVYTQDVVDPMMQADGRPTLAKTEPPPGTRTVVLGDVQRDPDTQAPAAPPSLRAPGEKPPPDQDHPGGNSQRPMVNGPVHFPTDPNVAKKPAQIPAPPDDPSSPATTPGPSTAPPTTGDASQPASPSAAQPNASPNPH